VLIIRKRKNYVEDLEKLPNKLQLVPISKAFRQSSVSCEELISHFVIRINSEVFGIHLAAASAFVLMAESSPVMLAHFTGADVSLR
jgi:hypothetical protein